MKTTLFVLLASTLLLAPALAEPTEINGTWSGNWTPKGGVPDSVTVELRRDTSGKLTGKFLTPAAMEFSKASFNPATGVVSFEATDQKSGKLYKLDGKVKGTEITGTFGTPETTGDIRLIKWTFFGH